MMTWLRPLVESYDALHPIVVFDTPFSQSAMISV